MTITSVSNASAANLPQALATAQSAMCLPEVQEMLRRLSEHQLGIFMPHMHETGTTDFQALPDDIVLFPDEPAAMAAGFQPYKHKVKV